MCVTVYVFLYCSLFLLPLYVVDHIVSAIKDLKVRGGCSRQAITGWVEANHKGAPIQKGVIARALKKGTTTQGYAPPHHEHSHRYTYSVDMQHST
jgi:hypothetical protein